MIAAIWPLGFWNFQPYTPSYIVGTLFSSTNKCAPGKRICVADVASLSPLATKLSAEPTAVNSPSLVMISGV
ncbi:MAG: hypothetical protein BWY67_02489 [Bacteroidetes bacterium ADurb.Bin397]|nr:MAG: hypothetical protein BWY67_02489 [Bacteroidetes bacterium ADurb.Bin397]